MNETVSALQAIRKAAQDYADAYAKTYHITDQALLAAIYHDHLVYLISQVE